MHHPVGTVGSRTLIEQQDGGFGDKGREGFVENLGIEETDL